MNKLVFVVKKTTECSDEELKQMNDLFNEVFEKSRSFEVMLNQYIQNPLGFSYHSMIIDSGKIVGMNVYIPVYFRIHGQKVLFADIVDSMISKPYRDVFNYIDMANAGYKRLKNDGIVFAYGYPNDNAYPVTIKAKVSKEVGKMYTYCLPYRIGGIKKGLTLLNWLSIVFCRIWALVAFLLASTKVPSYMVEKDLTTYNETRYKRNDGQYCFGDGFVYKVMDYEGIRAVFLIDVFEKSAKNFCKAVKYIMREEKKNFDILLYPGHLTFSHSGMIKIPHKFEPKRFVLTGKILDKSYDFSGLWNINNWDTNLSNYDLI